MSNFKKEKKEKKISGNTVIILATCLVVIAAVVVFTGLKLGWFNSQSGDDAEVAICDLSEITVSEDDITVTDEMVNDYIEELLASTSENKYTDEWVKKYSEENCSAAMNTTEEFDAYCRDILENERMNDAIFKYISENSEIGSYGYREANVMEYLSFEIEYQANLAGKSADEYAVSLGYKDAEDYEKAEARKYLKDALIIEKICEEKGIEITEEEKHDTVEKYIKENGLEEQTWQLMKEDNVIDEDLADAFLDYAGYTWEWLFEDLNIKYDKAMESLHDNVVVG